jgi:hypothetical protein
MNVVYSRCPYRTWVFNNQALGGFLVYIASDYRLHMMGVTIVPPTGFPKITV